MKELLSKAKSSFNPFTSQSPQPQPYQPSTLAPPTAKDLYRYRYTHGVNLGSVFLLERWLTPSMFLSSCPDSDEIDAVTSLVLSRGLEATKSKWEAHWRNVLKEEGFGMVCERGAI
jgi:aryl-phospho-beta-D-glucosidase BglC (GH1 family)